MKAWDADTNALQSRLALGERLGAPGKVIACARIHTRAHAHSRLCFPVQAVRPIALFDLFQSMRVHEMDLNGPEGTWTEDFFAALESSAVDHVRRLANPFATVLHHVHVTQSRFCLLLCLHLISPNSCRVFSVPWVFVKSCRCDQPSHDASPFHIVHLTHYNVLPANSSSRGPPVTPMKP